MNAGFRRLLKLFLLTFVLLVPSLTILGGVSAAGNCGSDLGAFPANAAAGAAGRVAHVFSTLRTGPAGSVIAVVFAPANFDLIADASGPASLCVNGLRWLHIRYKDGPHINKAGWALESQNFFDGTYGPGTWLAPGAAPSPPPPPAPVACTATNTPNSLPTQFATVAATTAGKITARFSTLRPAPAAATGTVINNPATGAGPTFKVLGTQALGGFCWVNIQYLTGATGTGWALESQRFPGIYGAGYWLTKTAN